MGRRVELDVDKSEDAPGFYINYDDYGTLLYYAYIVNPLKASQLYKAIVSEYHYKLNNNLSVAGLTEQNNNQAYLSLTDLPAIVMFIDNEILPSLKSLPPDLDIVDTWNTGGNLESFLMNVGGFFDYFNIDGLELDNYTAYYFIGVFTQLRFFFQDVIVLNVPYKITIA